MKRYFMIVTSTTLLAGTSLWSCQGNKSSGGFSKVFERWNTSNAPERLEWDFERDFYELPLQAKLDAVPWADSYWPSQRGGLASRWNSSGQGFGFGGPSLEALRRMSEREIKGLSPAEKYDIFVGNYDYPTLKGEQKRTSPTSRSWEGICHGWAPAAFNYVEPDAVTLTGANGIRVPFGSSDIKALLSFYQGETANPRPVNRMLGARCDVNLGSLTSRAGDSSCRDVNAGAFHLVLANYIGIRKHGFVADVTRDFQVWNHPIYKYKTRVVSVQAPSPGAAAQTVKELMIETAMTYVVESQPAWRSWRLSPNINYDATKNYQYRLELNANDEIVGGEWLTTDRPDFLWFADRPDFTGYFSALGVIYSAGTLGRDPLNGPPDGPVVDPSATPAPTPPVDPSAGPGTDPTAVPGLIPSPPTGNEPTVVSTPLAEPSIQPPRPIPNPTLFGTVDPEDPPPR